MKPKWGNKIFEVNVLHLIYLHLLFKFIFTFYVCVHLAVLSYESSPAVLLLHVCLSYIRTELQQLSHSPHYINLPFILKCVPACLAQHSVQGKDICFVLCPSPILSFFFLYTDDQGGREREQELGLGGYAGGAGRMTNGLRAANREGHRCQSHESSNTRAHYHSPFFLHLSPYHTLLWVLVCLCLIDSFVQILFSQHLSPHLAHTITHLN